MKEDHHAELAEDAEGRREKNEKRRK